MDLWLSRFNRNNRKAYKTKRMETTVHYCAIYYLRLKLSFFFVFYRPIAAFPRLTFGVRLLSLCRTPRATVSNHGPLSTTPRTGLFFYINSFFFFQSAICHLHREIVFLDLKIWIFFGGFSFRSNLFDYTPVDAWTSLTSASIGDDGKIFWLPCRSFDSHRTRIMNYRV